MSHVDLGLAIDNAVLVAVGYAVLYALGIVELRLGSLVFVGLAYLVGWACIGVLLTLALLAGIDPGIPTFLVIAGAIIVCSGLYRARRPGSTFTPREHAPRSRRASLLAALPAVLGATMLAIGSLAALSVAVKGQLYAGYLDSFDFWIPKAETIYYAHGIDPDVWATIRHPEYPPLVAVMDALTFRLVGGFHPSVLPFQATLLGIAFLMAVLALVLLAAATLTKLEGGFMAGLLALVVASAGIVLYRHAAAWALVLLAAPAVALPWRLWLHHHGLTTTSPDYHATDLLNRGFLSERWGRLTGSFHALYEGLITAQLQTSVIIWISVAALLILALRLPVIAGAVAAWFVLSLLGLTIVYWIGRLTLSWYLTTSLSRVGTTVIIVGGTLTPLFLGLALRPRRAR